MRPAYASLGSFLKQPLQGKTSLSRVFWLYGALGSVLISALGLVLDGGNEFMMGAYTVFGLVFGIYVSVATYRCAGNCASKFWGRMARVSAVLSLLLLPLLVYLALSGPLTLTIPGEQ